jgi:hypothetical protein
MEGAMGTTNRRAAVTAEITLTVQVAYDAERVEYALRARLAATDPGSPMAACLVLLIRSARAKHAEAIDTLEVIDAKVAA